MLAQGLIDFPAPGVVPTRRRNMAYSRVGSSSSWQGDPHRIRLGSSSSPTPSTPVRPTPLLKADALSLAERGCVLFIHAGGNPKGSARKSGQASWDIVRLAYLDKPRDA